MAADKSAFLIGYYNFPKAQLVIEGEIILEKHAFTTASMAAEIKAIENELYPDHEPYMRVADSNNIILVTDLNNLHNLTFRSTSKDSLDAMINKVRMWIGAGRIIVHPRCKHLIGALKNGVWNKQRTEFARSATYGHYDILAALVYLVRNIDEYTNPIPRLYGRDSLKVRLLNPHLEETDTQETLKQIFSPSQDESTDLY